VTGEVEERRRVDVMRAQLATFRRSLEEFALKYKNDIRRRVHTTLPLPVADFQIRNP
jgi:hypothetical protein